MTTPILRYGREQWLSDSLKPEEWWCSFLAVYDGHEGSDVSQYLANHLHPYIQQSILSLRQATVGFCLL